MGKNHYHNITKNQHYISCAEQRLNSCNPKVSKKDKQKIYSFYILDRDKHMLELENNNGILIKKNLSFDDLFSFDLPNKNDLRKNFESQFSYYEQKIQSNTLSLLNKLRMGEEDVKIEIFEIYKAKFLNFTRNPYSIQKVLNTFPDLLNYKPTDPDLLNIFTLLIDGERPQRDKICEKFGINNLQYDKWLRVIFMLLGPFVKGRETIFEGLIQRVFEKKGLYIFIRINDYDKERCLLSDRGFCQISNDSNTDNFAFNLCSNAFISYTFADIYAHLQDEMHESYIDDCIKRLPINVSYMKNEMLELENYNKRVIDQAHSRVFCSSKEVYLGDGA